MAQVSYPGVYIREIPSGVRTITSVSTSIAAFFGRASKGPIDTAKRILSLADYERTFGDPYPKSDLAHSVRQFFANGGTDCYVIRLAKGAKKAEVTLENLNGTRVLVATAKAEGLWGNTVRLEVDYNTPNPDESFNLKVIHEEEGVAKTAETHAGLSMDPSSAKFAPDFVTSSSELIELTLASAMGDPSSAGSTINTLGAGGSFGGFSNGRRPLGADGTAVATTLTNLIGAGQTSFDISTNGSAYKTVDLSSAPFIPAPSTSPTIATILSNIESKVNGALAQLSPAQTASVSLSNVSGLGQLLTITSNAGSRSAVRVRRASSKDISAALMLGVDQGGVEPVRYSNFRPAPTASLLRVSDTTATPGNLGALNDVAAVQQSAITQIMIDAQAVALNTGDYDIETNAGSRWYKNKSNDSTVTGDNDGVREKLKIIAKAINDNSELKYRAEVWGYQLALIALEGTINNQPSSVTTGTSDFDNGITRNVRQYSLGTAGSGDDGEAPTASEYKGNETKQTGFHALDKVDLFNLMVLPEDEEVSAAIMKDLWGPASTYCKKHRAFLLVDPPADWTDKKTWRPAVVQDVTKINDLRRTLEKDYSAVFYPRLKHKVSGVSRTIAPAGAIAGLMARTDASRGVWKAPAGIDAGLRAISGVNVELTDADNGVLNKKGVNCIRAFPNGIVNWGSRTLEGDDDSSSDWKYIPIRRLALMIEESLFRGTRWAVFEPNDERLWSNIRLNLNAYMMSLFRDGAFQGTDPKAAFYVKCDKETTTQDDRNKGIVNIEVGFAPVKPAEFVVIKIQQIAGEL